MQSRQFNLMSPVCYSLLAILHAALSWPPSDKISMWLHGTCFECLYWRIRIHVKDEEFAVCLFDSAGSLLINAVFCGASCDHRFTERQLDHRNVAACAVDLTHTEKRGPTPELNSLIKQARGSLRTRVQSGSETTSALCLCMPCSVGILPPTAGSCCTRLAHISAPAPPHAVHGSY